MATSALDQARHDADSVAQEARELILGMRDQHANFVLVLDAVREAVADADWADFSAVLESLEDAAKELHGVRATTPEESGEWMREELAEARQA